MSLAVSQDIQGFLDLTKSLYSAPVTPDYIRRPDKLLSAFDGLNPLASTRTVHASTLFSDGAVQGDRINPHLVNEFSRAHNQGITALYVIGMWEATAFSELWTRYWAPTWSGYQSLKPDWVGSSTFSIDDYKPNSLVGSWENLDKVITCAGEHSITLMPCFVTNTIGMGGAFMRRSLRQNPETISSCYIDGGEYEYLRNYADSNCPVYARSITREKGSSAGSHTLEVFPLPHGGINLFRYQFHGANGEFQRAYLQMNGSLYRHAWVCDRAHDGAAESLHCILLGSEDPFDRNRGGATVWSDVVQLSVHLREAREQQMKEYAPVLERFPHIRCDMAHLAGVDAWRDYPAIARSHGHTIKRMVLETYFEHGSLQNQDPSIAPYASFLYKWLHNEQMNIPSVMSHIHDDRSVYNNHRLMAFVENHDDKGTLHLPTKGAQALIITAAPVESVLWGQNQRIGDEFKIGAQMHLSRADVLERQRALLTDQGREHLDYLQFFRRVERISALPVFRSPDSTWKRAEFEYYPAEGEKIFHIARTLPNEDPDKTDRALVIVDARFWESGNIMRCDLTKTFDLKESELTKFSLVNLITGEIIDATPQVSIIPKKDAPAPHSYAYALVLKERLFELHSQ